MDSYFKWSKALGNHTPSINVIRKLIRYINPEAITIISTFSKAFTSILFPDSIPIIDPAKIVKINAMPAETIPAYIGMKAGKRTG